MIYQAAAFPQIDLLNQYRTHTRDLSCGYARSSHEDDELRVVPMYERIGSWFAHKALCVICLPVNIAAVGVGVLGMVVTPLTLGAVKVFIYAATLGNTQPEFSTGYPAFRERASVSIRATFSTAGEFVYSTFYELFRAVLLIPKRILLGLEAAAQDENKCASMTLSDPIVKLHMETEARSCFNLDQTLATWAEHKLYSLINIPVQASIAVLALSASVAVSVAFLAKALFIAMTDIPVPMPTGCLECLRVSIYALGNAGKNIGDLLCDIPILVYRVAESLHMTESNVSVQQLLLYIPRAIFS